MFNLQNMAADQVEFTNIIPAINFSLKDESQIKKMH
jgi:hypothetical protein